MALFARPLCTSAAVVFQIASSLCASVQHTFDELAACMLTAPSAQMQACIIRCKHMYCRSLMKQGADCCSIQNHQLAQTRGWPAQKKLPPAQPAAWVCYKRASLRGLFPSRRQQCTFRKNRTGMTMSSFESRVFGKSRVFGNHHFVLHQGLSSTSAVILT